MLVVLPDRIRRATLVNRVWFVMIFHSARQISVGKGNDMEFGVQVNVYRTNWDAVKASVEAMEVGDWDSVWFADHFIPPGANHDQEALTAFEGLSAIAFAGGMTKKLRLGNLVLGNTYRNPGLTAKIAGTIDSMSEGRFTL
ncbi:MAG TPA: LLM class flavin-dependent oxidoreductase, partial [Gammaproteobacteria bacterium]|nr:LLM class flavin-dependent oxidoreductase [Gammaproteobacteria bacterium]